MKFQKTLITLCFLQLIPLLTGCFSTGKRTNSNSFIQQDKEDLSAVRIKKGRGYYLRECSGCHPYIKPSERTREEWLQILAHKKNKVSLTKNQFAKLEEYILSKSEGEKDNIDNP